MTRAVRVLLSLVAFVSAALTATAAPITYTYSGPSPVNIPDGNPAGVNLDITVPDTFGILSFQSASVTMGATHSFVGDLRITLTHVPTGTMIDLIRRPGKSFLSNLGDSSNFGGTYTFSNLLALTNPAQPRIIDAADFVDGATLIPNGVYRPTTNSLVGNPFPTFSGETITDLNTTFDGLSNVAGLWRLNISDSSSSSTGSIAGFSFTFEPTQTAEVPEPTTLALLGVGVAALIVRRRRR